MEEIPEGVNLEHSDDSSDEEVLVRRGDVPAEWYNEFEHAGYDAKGTKVIKQKDLDEIDEYLRRQNDPKWWS